MKKYVVMHVFTHVLPVVVFQTDDYAHAAMYASLMKMDTGGNYVVAKVEDN